MPGRLFPFFSFLQLFPEEGGNLSFNLFLCPMVIALGRGIILSFALPKFILPVTSLSLGTELT